LNALRRKNRAAQFSVSPRRRFETHDFLPRPQPGRAAFLGDRNEDTESVN
jgi:hypothetical protein